MNRFLEIDRYHLDIRYIVDPKSSAICQPDYVRNARIVLIGCGGTGSLLVPNLCRLSTEICAITNQYRTQHERPHDGHTTREGLEIILVDMDSVEKKNLLRQNFCESDLGKNKARALAERYSAVFGRAITCIEKKMDREMFQQAQHGELAGAAGYTIYVTCVDNHKARVQMAEAFAGMPPTTLWIDSGNELTNGQIFISGSFAEHSTSPMINAPSIRRNGETLFVKGFRTNLLQAHPNIVELANRPVRRVSCAERTVSGEQSFAINQTAANAITNILSTILRGGDLNFYELQFDTDCGTEKMYACDYRKNAEKAEAELRKKKEAPKTEEQKSEETDDNPWMNARVDINS